MGSKTQFPDAWNVNLTQIVERAVGKVFGNPKSIITITYPKITQDKDIAANIATSLIPELMQFLKEEKNKMSDENLQKKIQGYINSFRNEIGQYLSPEIGQKFNIVSFPDGVIIDVTQESDLANSDSFKEDAKSLKEAFDKLGRKFTDYVQAKSIEEYEKDFSGSLKTNMEVYVGESILIISDKDNESWTAESAKDTVNMIVDCIEKANEKPKI